MTGILFWSLSLVLFHPEEREMSERRRRPASRAITGVQRPTRLATRGSCHRSPMTPHMARWDRWGRQVLRDGDIVFRMGDARLLHGYFPFSRFLANCSNSRFSHTGIVAIEKEGPVVYDMKRPAVARQPFCVWVLDNVGSIGVKASGPGSRGAIPQVLAYCRRVYQDQVPFDYELGLDDFGPLLRRDDPEGLHGGRDRAFQADPPRRHGACGRVPGVHFRREARLRVHAGPSPHLRLARLFPRQ